MKNVATFSFFDSKYLRKTRLGKSLPVLFLLWFGLFSQAPIGAATVNPGDPSLAFYSFADRPAGATFDGLQGAFLADDDTFTARIITDNSNVRNKNFASSDGIVWYNIFETAGGSVQLYGGPSFSTGGLSLSLLNADSGAPLNIIDLATADGNLFYFLTGDGVSSPGLTSGILQDDGSFVTTLLSTNTGLPAGTVGMGTADGTTFYFIVDDGAGTLASYSGTFNNADGAFNTTLLADDSGLDLTNGGLVAALTSVELVNNGPVCPGERLIASNNNGYPINTDNPEPEMDLTFMSFNWEGPGGFTSTDMNIQVFDFSAADAGEYSVTITFPAGNTQVCSFDVAVSDDCDEPCECATYAYVNDRLNNITHKFEIQPDGSFAEIGAPWLPFMDGRINEPHGVSVDPNGFIYIAELFEEKYWKLTCDGEFVDADPSELVDGFNHVIIGDFMYIVFPELYVEVYELCDNSTSLVGFVQMGEFADLSPNTENWGITFNPIDSMIYVTDNYNGTTASAFAPGEGDIYVVDPRNPLDAGSVWQTNAVIPPILSGFDRLMGITFDDENNMYFVEQTVNIANSTIHKYSFNGTMWTPVTTIEDNTVVPRREGFYNAWGITWSKVTDELLVTSFSEDCIARIDADNMTYIGPAIPHVPGANAKAIDVTEECCYRGPDEIDVDVCAGGQLLLRDALDCAVCTGVFNRVSGTGGEYDECTQIFTADENTTNSEFTFTDNNQGCGPVSVTVNLIFIETVINSPTLEAGEICTESDAVPLPAVVSVINNNGGAELDGDISFNLIVGTDTSFNQTTFFPSEYPAGTTVIVSVNFDPDEAIGPCALVRDFPVLVTPEACCPYVTLVPQGMPVCSVDSVNLGNLIDSIFQDASYVYTWTTNGDGTFNGDDPDGDTSTGLFPSASFYTPGTDDVNSGRVMLTLSTTDGDPGECPQRSASVLVDVLKVGCGVFNWDGGN